MQLNLLDLVTFVKKIIVNSNVMANPWFGLEEIPVDEGVGEGLICIVWSLPFQYTC